jgi:hypothetical protein
MAALPPSPHLKQWNVPTGSGRTRNADDSQGRESAAEANEILGMRKRHPQQLKMFWVQRADNADVVEAYCVGWAVAAEEFEFGGQDVGRWEAGEIGRQQGFGATSICRPGRVTPDVSPVEATMPA